MPDFIAIDALNPPIGMMVYRTTVPAGIYVKSTTGWDYLSGFPNGNATFNSVTVNGAVTALNFSGPLTGNASTATLATTATNSNNSAVTNDISNPATTYPVFVNSTPGYQPLRTSSGNLSYVPATGILTARGFNGPLVGDVTGNATAAEDAQNTVNMRITNNVLNPAVVYPTFVSGTSGPLPPSVANTKLSFIPLSGELKANTFRGDLIGNASFATSVTGNVAAANGGTGQTTYSPGDMLFANTSTSLMKLPIGVPGTVLRVSAGNIPGWSTAGAGTVINVTGTPNRITVSDPTVSPSLDIAATYAGQASIATVGTITAGTWNGTEVDVAHGGTGRTTLPTGRVLVGNGIGTVNAVDGDVPNLVLTSNGPGLAPTFKAPGAGDMVLSAPQTITGIKTFGGVGNVGKLILAGNTTGTTILDGPGTGIGGTVVLPQVGTLATLAGAENLLNKTLTSPTLTTPSIGEATGATLRLGGGSQLTTTDQVGTGRIVLENNPTLITPDIGVARGTSLNLGAGGTVTAAQFTGNAATVTAVGGVGAAQIASGAQAANAASVNNAGGRIIIRDAIGDFSANVITAVTFNGNATNATSASNAGRATNADNTAITDDLATVGPVFPTFVNANAGNRDQRVSSTKLSFSPASGLLTATNMSAGQYTSTVGNGTAPFIVNSNTAVVGLNIGGNAGTATKLAAPVSIYGADFDGSAALAGLVSGQFGGTGMDNSGKTIDINGGNFSTSGAGTLNFNTGGVTNVTLPLTGTLYGTAGNSITSAQLSTSMGADKTGTGLLVFATDAKLVKPVVSSLLGDVAYLASKANLGTNVGVASDVAGTNLGGTVTIVMTGIGAASNKLIEVRYSEAFPAGSYPVLYPANPAAAELTGLTQVYATGFTDRFEIHSGSTGLANGATYVWNYQVVGR